MTSMDDTPQKGQAAPLEGTLGKDIMMVLGIGFASMSLHNCLSLAAAPMLSMDGMSKGPLQLAELESFMPVVAAATNALMGGAPSPASPANSLLSGPKMSGPSGTGFA